MSGIARYLHILMEDGSGDVSTVEIYKDGHVAFGNIDGDFSDEYSIQDVKDVLAEAEYVLDHSQDTDDSGDGDGLDDGDDWDAFNDYDE